jgi:PIN domain nuclease of toxin-antitoxin system
MGNLCTGGYLILCAVADTHTVIWYIFSDLRLSTIAEDTILITLNLATEIIMITYFLKKLQIISPGLFSVN